MLLNFWWVWMIMAALFMIGEIFTAGFFLIWFGIGAVVAGVLALFGLGAVWQWGAFVVVSGALLPFSRKFAQKVTQEQPSGIGAERNIGKTGIVLTEVDNDLGAGQIRVDNELWRAKSESGRRIPPGARVKVIAQEGTQLSVTVIQEEQGHE